MERAARDSQRQGEIAQGGAGTESRPPLHPFRQPGIPPEAEHEVQERAWERIRGEAARLEERDREVAGRGRRLREEEAVAAPRGTGSSQTQSGTPPPRIGRDGHRA